MFTISLVVIFFVPCVLSWISIWICDCGEISETLMKPFPKLFIKYGAPDIGRYQGVFKDPKFGERGEYFLCDYKRAAKALLTRLFFVVHVAMLIAFYVLAFVYNWQLGELIFFWMYDVPLYYLFQSLPPFFLGLDFD